MLLFYFLLSLNSRSGILVYNYIQKHNNSLMYQVFKVTVLAPDLHQ